MADIFISYANEDRETAGQLARALESAGMSVWWDRRIPAGRTWRSVLEEALGGMRCLIVLWSENSLKSPWVLEEAEEARRLEKLLFPVLIESVAPPVGFRAIQAANLVDWDGAADAPTVKLLVADLQALLGESMPRAAIHVADHQIRDQVSSDDSTPDSLSALLARHWKMLVGGCAGVALILGVFMISQRIDKAAGSKPALPISPPASLSPPTRRLTAVVIDGPTRQLKPADTVTLKLQGHFSDGTKSDLADSIKWLSSDNRIAVVDAQGKVTVVQPGTAEISAQQGALVSAPWMVAVKADEKIAKEIPAVKIVTLGITPARRELLTNERIALRVHGRYSDQSEKPISRDLRWLISDSTIASITAEGQLSGLRPGRVDVVVRTGEVSSAPVTIVVKELPKKPPVETPLVKAAPEIKALPPVPVVRPSLTPYIASAKSLREQGQYTAALAELARAVAIDATNSEVLKEIEQTKRACAAERSLGNRVDC